MAKVCVIMTVHDTRIGYFIASLVSLSFQEFTDFEVIVIDDASEKEDYSFLKKPFEFVKGRGPLKIRYVRNEKNLGLCRSVNLALSLVSKDCSYVIRLGSDDLFDKRLLRKEVEFLNQHPDFIACCCGLKCFGTKVKTILRPADFTPDCNLRGKAHAYGYAGGMMFRREALEHCSIDENLIMCEDLDFHFQLLKLGRIKGLEPLYLYRHHKNNLCKTVSTERRLECLEYIFKKHDVHKDLVSIIMPVYNTDLTLFVNTLRSIIRQNYKNYELIIINDGSNPEINYRAVAEFRKLRNIIQYVEHETNQGIPSSLNEACKLAHGEYIVRIDSDDIADNDFLEREHNFLKNNPEYIAVCCDLRLKGLQEGTVTRPKEFNLKNIHDIRSAHGYGYGCSYMWRKYAMGTCSFDLKYAVCEDFDFTLQLLKIGKIKGLPAMYTYIRHRGSTIGRYNNQQRHELINAILDKHGLR